MTNGHENDFSQLWALERSKRKTILDCAWRDAFKKEGKLQVLLKWYALLCIGLVIGSFCLGYGAGVALPGTDSLAIMVPLALLLGWSAMHERIQVCFLRSYLLKRLSVNKL